MQTQYINKYIVWWYQEYLVWERMEVHDQLMGSGVRFPLATKTALRVKFSTHCCWETLCSTTLYIPSPIILWGAPPILGSLVLDGGITTCSGIFHVLFIAWPFGAPTAGSTSAIPSLLLLSLRQPILALTHLLSSSSFLPHILILNRDGHTSKGTPTHIGGQLNITSVNRRQVVEYIWSVAWLDNLGDDLIMQNGWRHQRKGWSMQGPKHRSAPPT